jgi:hypothetical protein
LLLGYKPVQHVTVLNTVGNCNTVVSIVILLLYYIIIFLHEIRKQKANWIGHILRRNCLLKQVIERKIKEEMEVTRRQGRRHRKPTTTTKQTK